MKVHIIGGTGQMGSWLSSFLRSRGVAVTVSGSKGVSEKILKESEVVFISVPISLARAVIKEAAKLLNPETVLVDLSSVQQPGTEILEKLLCPSAGLHLLFGPTVSSVQNQKIILSRIKDSSKIDELKELFEQAGAQVFEMSPKQHDFLMAHLQNLTHFVNLSLAQVLIEDQVSLNGKISTPVFLAQLSALNRVAAQSPDLLAEIQLGNHEAAEVLEKLIKIQRSWLNLIVNRKEVELKQQFSLIHHSLESSGASKQSQSKTKVSETKNGELKLDESLAFLGPVGTFSYSAALSIVKLENQLVSCDSILQVFEAVSEGKCSFGLVPAENSTEGTIRETLDFLVEFDLKVDAAIEVPIHQNLMSKEKSLEKITQVFSHPQALAQCREWLRQNLPDAKQIVSSSTVSAIKEIKDKEDAAVIGGKVAAQIYDLNILAENIEDNQNNITKFYLISKDLKLLTSPHKTLLFLSVFNRVGVLRDILDVFASLGINLCKIESRPSKEKTWDYYFFIEVEIAMDDPKLDEALNILRQYCPVIKILGSV